MESANENVSEIQRERQLFRIPVDAVISNHRAKKHPEETFMMYWKNRRNYNIAMKKRLREGPNATVMIDLDTMSVVTEREQMIENMDSLAPIETKSMDKVKRIRLPKGMRYASR